ncbi:conserved hypothetical protein [Ricinus communis]|uniref:Methyl-accepting chemotaxis protein n=1 Tax=Ricinus communis TaxID=3988 RepID=B9TAB7_RICCO|nr:conserved hypothetical protein [Ricinus communis]
MPAIAKASELYLANNAMDATRVMVKEIRPAQKKWLEALDQLGKLEDKLNAQTQVDAEAAFASARNFMLVLLALAVALGILAATVITRGLLKQLGGEPGYTAKIAGSIAEGDLSIAIDTKSSDRGSLLIEMKQMRNSLVDIVSQSLQDQAAELQRVVSIFKLAEGEEQAVVNAPAAPAAATASRAVVVRPAAKPQLKKPAAAKAKAPAQQERAADAPASTAKKVAAAAASDDWEEF